MEEKLESGLNLTSKVKPLNVVSFSSRECELAAISIDVDGSKKMLVVARCRPPIYDWLILWTYGQLYLHSLSARHSNIFVLGDSNIDFSDECFKTTVLFSYVYFWFKKPVHTREALGSQSVKDHVFTKVMVAKTIIICSTLSDHYAKSTQASFHFFKRNQSTNCL